MMNCRACTRHGTVRDLSPITAKRYDDLLRRFAAYRRSGDLLEVGRAALVKEVEARGHIMHTLIRPLDDLREMVRLLRPMLFMLALAARGFLSLRERGGAAEPA
jgi:hypothetical protein